MRTALRNTLAVVIGMVVGGVVIMLVEKLGHQFYPPPSTELGSMAREAMIEWFDEAPFGAFAWVLGAWLAGAFVGGGTAAMIATRAPVVMALIVAAAQTAGGIYTVNSFPHPEWFTYLGPALFVPFALLGAWASKQLRA